MKKIVTTTLAILMFASLSYANGVKANGRAKEIAERVKVEISKAKSEAEKRTAFSNLQLIVKERLQHADLADVAIRARGLKEEQMNVIADKIIESSSKDLTVDQMAAITRQIEILTMNLSDNPTSEKAKTINDMVSKDLTQLSTEDVKEANDLFELVIIEHGNLKGSNKTIENAFQKVADKDAGLKKRLEDLFRKLGLCK
jgi:hypothetical protein